MVDVDRNGGLKFGFRFVDIIQVIKASEAENNFRRSKRVVLLDVVSYRPRSSTCERGFDCAKVLLDGLDGS